MDLDQLLNEVRPNLNEASKVPEDTAKLIKNIDSLTLNMALKRVDKISAHMKTLASRAQGNVKTLILRGAKSAFDKSRKEATEFRKKFDDDVNQYVEKTVTLIQSAKNEVDAQDKIDKNAPKFQNFFNKMTENIISEYEKFDDGLVRRNPISLDISKIQDEGRRNAAKEYYELSTVLIEYYVRELLKVRVVLSIFQVFLSRVRKQVEYKEVVTTELPFIFKGFIRNKLGAETGKYLVAHVEKYYSTTERNKEEFQKFENLMNDLLGIK